MRRTSTKIDLAKKCSSPQHYLQNNSATAVGHATQKAANDANDAHDVIGVVGAVVTLPGGNVVYAKHCKKRPSGHVSNVSHC